MEIITTQNYLTQIYDQNTINNENITQSNNFFEDSVNNISSNAPNKLFEVELAKIIFKPILENMLYPDSQSDSTTEFLKCCFAEYFVQTIPLKC